MGKWVPELERQGLGARTRGRTGSLWVMSRLAIVCEQNRDQSQLDGREDSSAYDCTDVDRVEDHELGDT